MAEIIFPNQLPIPIVQQKDGKIDWVSPDENVFTQFIQPYNNRGTYAYIAHNYGAGKHLFNLKIGDVIAYTKKDKGMGALWKEEVKEIRKYQALQPKNVLSPLIDLASGKKVKAEDATHEIYRNNKRTVFQTCIEKNGNPNWGRIFVITE